MSASVFGVLDIGSATGDWPKMRKSFGLLPLTFTLFTVFVLGCPSGPTPKPGGDKDKLLLGAEYPPAGEEVAGEKALATITSLLTRLYPPGKLMVRDAHPKHHGCVRARFSVRDDLPPLLAHGAFTPGASYDAWVRFSNASRTVQADDIGDGRGISIKLLGVDGDKLLPEGKDEKTLDFLMINHPAFFVKDAIQYADFVKNDALDKPVAFFVGLKNPKDWHLRGLTIAGAIISQKVGNPLEIEYHSMTPYRLGPPVQAVKYRVKPCEPSETPIPEAPGHDYLRDAMSTTLAARDACFTFDVQIQTSATRMPMEDATVTWNEKESPFVNVARLMISAQAFESEGQMRYCEDLSYTPWHATEAHRPLGSLNRIRKDIYIAISKLRHTHNSTPRREPTDLELPPAYRDASVP